MSYQVREHPKEVGMADDAPFQDSGTQMKGRRAIVLGGGGVTGIAWEVGILAGLHAAGVDLNADAVFGTSAGAFVGVALASGHLYDLYAAQQRPAPDERIATVSMRLMARWAWAVIQGLGSAERIGTGFGAVARRGHPKVSEDERRRVVAGRLTATRWPATLRVAVINAKSGVLQAFDGSCGFPLAEVVSASGAVPGISPMVRLGEQDWIDAGMVSSANARLADGYQHVLVLAPLPKGRGGVPSAAKDVKTMQRHASVELIVPDTRSVEAIGPNIYDPARRADVALAASRQGMLEAPRIAAMWHRAVT
jgi:NTE family protein